MNTQAYDRITERVVSLLEQGTVPWHKPWRVKTGLPRNLISKKPYRGINVFLLMSMSYESPYWLTLRQANQLGDTVKKGEKSCPVVFWKQRKIEDTETEESKRVPLLRLYHVFNVAQCEGLQDVPVVDDSPLSANKPSEIVANMPQPPVVKHGMACASYSLPEDTVGMPAKARFEGDSQYHATLFHELIHSTGHEMRLKRKGIVERNGFGTDPYCKEELVAELGSAFLCGQADIVDRTIDNSAAYLHGWLTRLKADRTLVVYAAAQAQKAADFILGRTFTESEVPHD